jgi:hypothetical protein
LPFEYLDKVCPRVIKSGHTVYPVAGGLDDQDPLFLADLDTYEWLLDWARQEAKGSEPDDED